MAISVQVNLRIEGETVCGEVALLVPPGTLGRDRDRLLDAAIQLRLAELADELRVVLAASPSSYCFPQPGNDAEGRARFEVRGRIEADNLIPARLRK